MNVCIFIFQLFVVKFARLFHMSFDLRLPSAVGRSVSLMYRTVYGNEDQLTVDLQLCS